FVWMPLLLLFVESLFGVRPFGDTGAECGKLQAPASDASGVPQGQEGYSSESRSMSPHRPVVFRVVGLGVIYAAFIWSHPPTAYQFSLVLAVVIAWLAISTRKINGVVLCAAGLIMGLGLAAVYLYPAAKEKDFIATQLIAQLWPYHENYLLVAHTPFFNVLLNHTWFLNLTIIVLCAGSTIISRLHGFPRGVAPRTSSVLLWVTIGLVASFMMTAPSQRIGRMIPMIDTGVYPWRMLAITSLMGALLGGAVLQSSFEASAFRRALNSRLLAYLAASVTVGSAVFSVLMVISTTYNHELFVPEPEHFNIAMLPRNVVPLLDYAPDHLDPERIYIPKGVPQAELRHGAGSFSVEVWDPEHREIAANLREPDQMSVRTFNYPGWAASIDGNPTQINVGRYLGNIELDVPAGSHKIVLDYLETPTRRWSRVVSSWMAVVAILMLGAAALRPPVRDKNPKGDLS
ncbi:MAG TPA: hypothetical protein VI756_07710, partial [Blastocatellia bacterium]